MFVIAFIAVVYLIFKFIKKLVFAVFTLVLLVVLVVGGVGGLVYLDFKQLSTQNDFDINLVYQETGSNDLVLGTNIPVRNQELNITNIEKLSVSELNNLDPEAITDNDNKFVIIITDTTFKEIMNKEVYDLNNIDGVDFSAYSTYDLTLTKNEIIQIIESSDGTDTLLEIILEKNGITGIAKEISKPMLKGEISKSLEASNLSFKEALFLFVLSQSIQNEQNVLTILDAYKNDDGVQVYPDRFTFKLVRMLPISTIQQYLPSFSN